MREIYLIRHGETDYNRNGIVQGSGVDAALNQRGRAQAQAFFERYGNVPFDAFLSSALQRSQQSLAPFLEASGAQLRIFPELNEISWGKYEGLTSTKDMHTDYKKLMEAWKTGDYTARIPGGESAEELAKRLAQVVAFLRNSPAKRTLICGHGRSNACLLPLLLEQPLHQMRAYRSANTGLYRLRFDGQRFELLLHNDTSHLPQDLRHD